MKSVLTVAPHYPPIAGSQAVRAAKLLKRLPEFGWMPHIVSAASHSSFGSDFSGLRAVLGEFQVDRLRFPLFSRMLPAALRMPDALAAWVPAAVARCLG